MDVDERSTSSSTSSGTANAGNFRRRIINPDEINICDLDNPWNFFNLMNQDDSTLNKWLIENHFMLGTIPCTKADSASCTCSGTMRVSQRAGRISGASLRCSRNRNHELAIRTYSFFEASKLCTQDIFMFIKCYLDGLSLRQTSLFAGVNYKSTAVDWASFIRELFKEHFHRNIKQRKFNGEVEIDESLFGRRVKYHKGNPNKGLKVILLYYIILYYK
ncbi:uncharacterized protein LOC132751642 [Ruditapes philippinarum]|uniref:uncharacterized protein LOC132751642 n=1 Tax=Ruditapes philippinarum TaxID=129788 RepID=UPI00295A7613|nr:uncharacterized protein LOC132751642 [Ruditapes philippinarum]